MAISKYFFLFLLPLLLSCHIKKGLPKRQNKCRLDYKSTRTLSSLMKSHQAKYSTFSGKIKAEMVLDDKQLDFSIILKMKMDSVLWASISSFGIEAVRFIATKDSVKFIDRLQNKYFSGNYDTLGKVLKTEVDLEMLQSLLVGNSVEFYEEDEKLRSGIDSCSYILGTIRKRKLRKVLEKGHAIKESAQNIWMVDSLFKISRILFKEFGSKREFDARFDEFEAAEIPEGELQKVLIPFRLLYHIKADKDLVVDLKYLKATANKPQSYPFTIPLGYDRIEK